MVTNLRQRAEAITEALVRLEANDMNSEYNKYRYMCNKRVAADQEDLMNF